MGVCCKSNAVDCRAANHAQNALKLRAIQEFTAQIKQEGQRYAACPPAL